MILGGVSKKGNFKIEKIPFQPTAVSQHSNLVVYGAGKSFLHFPKTNNEEYFICGSALDENYNLMTKSDWQKELQQKDDFSHLNGHFLILRVLYDKIEIYNDRLGLRKLFFYETSNEILFSSQLSWLLEFIENPQFNLNYLWSFWYLENPVEKACLIQNVNVMGERSKVELASSGIIMKSSPWLPEKRKTRIDEAVRIIEKTIDSVLNTTRKVCFGLSGGVDSRTLLAVFLDYDRNLWSTHTFGQKTHFDIHIANAIARYKKLNHTHHDIEPYQNDELFGTWQEFVLETNCLLPAYAYHELSYYKILPEDAFFIDGGKGEFIRRALSNRLAVLGKRALWESDAKNVKKFLLAPKPDIFSSEIIQNVNGILDQQIAGLISELPSAKDIGVENWVDLYNIRCRTSNSGYVSQTRLDSIIGNLMPFIQTGVLDIALNLPSHYRKNELLNRRIISRQPSLKFFPFARYKTIIPYQHNKYTAHAWGKLMSLMIKEKSDVIKKFAEINRDHCLSRLSDTDFINSSLFDSKKIAQQVRDFYAGKNDDFYFVIWWMTFDV